MAVLAIVEPLKLEKMVPPATVSRLSRPGSRPIHLSSTSRVRTAIPE